MTRPVGSLPDVCEATRVTVPDALALPGLVYVGGEVYPAEVPPEAESKRRRVLSKSTRIWYPPRTAAVRPPPGAWPVTPVRSTRTDTWTTAPIPTERGLGESVTCAVPLIGAP